MSDVINSTRRNQWQLYGSAIVTTDAAPTLADVLRTTNPGVDICVGGGPSKAYSPSLVEFMVLAVGSAANTPSVRVVGFSVDPTELRLVPTVLAKVTATLSAVALVSPALKTTASYAITEGTEDKDIRVLNSTAGFSRFRVDMSGCDRFRLDVNKNDATSVTIWYRPL